ncbi:lysozyme inhibitor LprI family protein [uncultured Psychrobacter sp.]|uniref:lysozyme inhibitor LprI family protein n=1 Tax=uncultured Psychrobacter sp. TaxID=259303 RepID=UPI0034581756
MKKIVLAVIGIISACLLSTIASSASFDCKKVETWVEKTVCANPKLSKLDDAMAQKYKQNLADTSDKDYKNNLIIDQRLWLKFQRNTCKDIECLIREYKEYIGEKAYYDWDSELSSSYLPDKIAFGDFSQTVEISTYNPDILGWDDAQDITNTVSIYSVAKKPDISVIEGDLIFTNFHSCVIESNVATWAKNHWVIYDNSQDKEAELRLYPAFHKGKAQLLLKDVDYQFGSGRCGVRGYFDGIVLEREAF